MRSSSILAVMEDCCWVRRRRASSSLSEGFEEFDINESTNLLEGKNKDADFEGSNLQLKGKKRITKGKYYFSYPALIIYMTIYRLIPSKRMCEILSKSKKESNRNLITIFCYAGSLQARLRLICKGVFPILPLLHVIR